MNQFHQRLLCGLLLFSVIALNAVPANAWGFEGHRITAIVAQRHLSDKARNAIKDLLGDNFSLAAVANYADDVRDDRPETYNFHFVGIPKNKNDYLAWRDCKNKPEGDCVIKALERFKTQAVSDPDKAKRTFALKFIVHLVGDMHQPLHCANNNDLGGNWVSVVFFNENTNTNLHKVWDSKIIWKVGLSQNQYADSVEQGLTDQQMQTIQQGTLIEWALEAHKVARDSAYAIPNNHKLGQAYFDKNKPVVDQQLCRGGLRLAKLLNDIFN